ncbi:MAG: winged helix-turn-helix domain-containing protein [Anaerolineales bacterium]
MAEDNEFIKALRSRLADYVSSIDQERKVVRGLLESIEQKEQHVLHIQKLLEAEGVNLEAEGMEVGLDVSLADLAHEVLSKEAKGQPVHYRELAQMIFKRGKNIPGKDPAANLIAHLGRDDRFQRAGRGLYGLTEWGLKPTSRKRRKSKRRRAQKLPTIGKEA